MDDVVEEHAADGVVAGAIVEGLVVEEELPGLVHGAVGGGFEEGVGFGAEFIEGGEKLGAGLHHKRLHVGFCVIKLWSAENDCEESWQLRGVSREFGQGHGLFVGLVVVLVERVGDTLEESAGLAELLVEFGEE